MTYTRRQIAGIANAEVRNQLNRDIDREKAHVRKEEARRLEGRVAAAEHASTKFYDEQIELDTLPPHLRDCFS